MAAWIGLAAATPAACRRSRSDPLAAGLSCRLAGKQIQWIVPNAPGGSYDAYSRLVAPFLEQELGARIVVRNLPGAAGMWAAGELSRATPDGTVVGILNGPGLVVASVAGVAAAPQPLSDFTILARISRNRHVWLTGADSGLHSMEDAFDLSRRRPLVFAVNNVGGSAFAGVVLTARLLGTPCEFVTGYQGSRAGSLAAIRGDVDLVSHSWETFADHIGSGDLRPILQISASAVSSDSGLDKIPLLGGADGIAEERARQLGRDAESALREAAAVERLLGGGRIIAAPAGMPLSLHKCLEETLLKTLDRPDLVTAARAQGRPLDVAGADRARRDLEAAAQIARRHLALIQAEIARIRG